MGTVYRKTYTKPLPANADTFSRSGKRYAKWKNHRNKPRTALMTSGKNGSNRIVVKAGTFTAKYRDGAGVVVEKATGCRDETAARSVLADLVRRAELVKANVLTAVEDAVSDHQNTSLAEHVAAYLVHLEAEGTCVDHRGNVQRCLNRIADDCRFLKLADMNVDAFERWLVWMTKEGMGARTKNLHRASAVAFCNWCVAAGRMTVNPFSKVKKANEDADPRRKRRAMNEDELTRLLEVARRRPLLDRMTVRRGKNKGKAVAKLRESTKIRLEKLGWERALIYKTLVLTGLRKKELASLVAGQLEIDGPVAFLELEAGDEKNREGSDIPIRADLADDLRQWLAAKLEACKAEARRQGEPIPARLPTDTPVFTVPDKLVRVLDRDLMAAGIPKRDERGRTVDVHALRHSFGTLLSKGGVSPRTAQAAMRHSTIDLTMNVYTDPRLLDVHGALDVLPGLPLVGGGEEQQRATGTAGLKGALAPGLAPKADNSGNLWSSGDKRATKSLAQAGTSPIDVSACPVNRKTPLTTADNGVLQVGDTGLEPVTPSLSS
jgi:integrase